MGQRLQENLLNQVNAPFTGAGTLKLFTAVIVAACNKLEGLPLPLASTLV